MLSVLCTTVETTLFQLLAPITLSQHVQMFVQFQLKTRPTFKKKKKQKKSFLQYSKVVCYTKSKAFWDLDVKRRVSCQESVTNTEGRTFCLQKGLNLARTGNAFESIKCCTWNSSKLAGQGSVGVIRQPPVRWSRPVQNASWSPDWSVGLPTMC